MCMCRWGEEKEIITEMKMKLEKIQGEPDSAANMVKDTVEKRKGNNIKLK